MSDKIKALARNMVERKRAGVEPYILFLGAGASISSGCSSMMKIIDSVLATHESKQFDKWKKKIEEATRVNVEYGELLKKEISNEKRECFFKVWNRLDHDSQYSILRKHFWEKKIPSQGYDDLSYLIKMGYIKKIMSTNLDNMLEKSLNNAGYYQPDNFIICVNRKDRIEEFSEQLESSRIPLKIVKLHGSLESPRSYAFTPEEIFDFEKVIKPTLSRMINQSLIVIGHSMQDRDIDVLFEDEGKEIHYVNPSPPRPDSRIDTILKVRRQGSIIKDKDARFDNFFRKLRLCIENELTENNSQNPRISIEGFLHNIGYDHELEVPRSRFRNLPTLYVKPTEYQDICSKLEREHVVFIIGEPHLGKTYTAFHILWEHYQQGYEIFHIRHDRLVTLLHQNNGEMKKLLVHLLKGKNGLPCIIHFDDPFGETLERRTDVFAKELDEFLNLIRGYEHLRVVVTTRLNIFREAMNEVHSCKKVEELEKDIRVHTSYRPDILRDIMHSYIQFYQPLWSSDKGIIMELDNQLPDLLPAPHNIEFFVRTSERLKSLEEVLIHVEHCKEMIKALGEWMASLPDTEQIFLVWLEICSTSSIIFPNTNASSINFEKAYRDTLAHMFKIKKINGIPLSPLLHARDKFDRILIESRDKETELTSLDFVHPSYHEAFWYTIKRKLYLQKWWELIKSNIGKIFKKPESYIDSVQLRMIERYGTINRDLDKLLLLSAESEDTNEQVIALGHMIERFDQFINLPQFTHCYNAIISSRNITHKNSLIKMINQYFNKMPQNSMQQTIKLLMDNDASVRVAAEELFAKHYETLPKAVKDCETMRGYQSLCKIILNQEMFTTQGFCMLTKTMRQEGITRFMNEATIHSITVRLLKCKPVELQRLMKMKTSQFTPMIDDTLFEFLYNYEKTTKEQRRMFSKLKSTPKIICKIRNYVQIHKYKYQSFSDNTLIELLTIKDECIKYEILPGLLLRFKKLSKQHQEIINELLNKPPSWWVGGSIGQISKKTIWKNLDKDTKKLPIILANHNNKKVNGAILAEFVQAEKSKRMILRKMYQKTLKKLLKDPEVVGYAKKWMDYQLEEFEFNDDKYWSEIKEYFQS